MSKIKKYIWNIIGVLGTIATFFFGIYGLIYVPKYAKDAYKERQEIANYEVINDLKEIIFSNQKYDSLIVSVLKKGKELKYDIILSKTNQEILIEVQENFLSDKYIPLEQRLLLYDRIEKLKTKSTEEKDLLLKSEVKKYYGSILLYILSVLSLLLSGLLLYGLIIRRKQQIDEEMERKFEEIEETRPEKIIVNRNFEMMVGRALKEMNLNFKDFTANPKEFPFDFSINLDDKLFGIEVISKITSDKLISIKQRFDAAKIHGLILLTNRVIEDFRTYQLLSDLKSKGLVGRRIYYVSAMDINSIKSEINKILLSEENNK